MASSRHPEPSFLPPAGGKVLQAAVGGIKKIPGLKRAPPRIRGAIERLLNGLGWSVVLTSSIRKGSISHDIEQDQRFGPLYEASRPYTMTTPNRMYVLYKAVEYLLRAGLPGDLVECGVWRGGSSMLAALTLKSHGSLDRCMYLYDTFRGMSQPTDVDVNSRGWRAKDALEESPRDAQIWGYASLDEVRTNMFSTGYPAEKIRFVEGKVEDTLPGQVPERIALLRLDTDWYESTYQELRHLFPRLVPGGVLIVDDYGYWLGQRKAVDRYFREEKVAMLLNRIDHSLWIGVKPGDVHAACHA